MPGFLIKLLLAARSPGSSGLIGAFCWRWTHALRCTDFSIEGCSLASAPTDKTEDTNTREGSLSVVDRAHPVQRRHSSVTLAPDMFFTEPRSFHASCPDRETVLRKSYWRDLKRARLRSI